MNGFRLIAFQNIQKFSNPQSINIFLVRRKLMRFWKNRMNSIKIEAKSEPESWFCVHIQILLWILDPVEKCSTFFCGFFLTYPNSFPGHYPGSAGFPEHVTGGRNSLCHAETNARQITFAPGFGACRGLWAYETMIGADCEKKVDAPCLQVGNLECCGVQVAKLNFK